MRVETELKLDFDDVLIRPKRSVAPSRASVDLERSHRFRNAVAGGGLDRHTHHGLEYRHGRDDEDGAGVA